LKQLKERGKYEGKKKKKENRESKSDRQREREKIVTSFLLHLRLWLTLLAKKYTDLDKSNNTNYK